MYWRLAAVAAVFMAFFAPGSPAPAPVRTDFGFDLRVNMLPQYADRTPAQIRTAIANYFINQQSNHDRVCRIQWQNVESGLVPVQYFEEAGTLKKVPRSTCLSEEVLSLYSDYPYACANGKRVKAEYRRLGWLAYRLMVQDTYHRAEKVPANRAEYIKALGSSLDFKNTNIVRKVIPESFVARDIRGIGAILNDRKAVTALTTFDFNLENKKGADAVYANNPIEITVDAAEVFMIKPNGLWKYALYDFKNDKRLDAAPAGVADFQKGLLGTGLDDKIHSVKAHANYASIRNGVDCLICHMEGTLSEGYSSVNKNIIQDAIALGSLTDPKDLSLARLLYNVPPGKENEPNYDPDTDVEKHLANVQRSFASALEEMQVRIDKKMVPVLPDASAVYLEPVDLNQMASELYVSVSEMEAASKNNATFRTLLGLRPGKTVAEIKLDRVLFETRYCKLLEILRPTPEAPLVKEEPRKPAPPPRVYAKGKSPLERNLPADWDDEAFIERIEHYRGPFPPGYFDGDTYLFYPLDTPDFLDKGTNYVTATCIATFRRGGARQTLSRQVLTYTNGNVSPRTHSLLVADRLTTECIQACNPKLPVQHNGFGISFNTVALETCDIDPLSLQLRVVTKERRRTRYEHAHP